MKSDRPMPTLATAAIDAPRRQAPAELHRPASVPPLDARRAAQPRLSCVVPCLNEADNLDGVLERLTEALASLTTSWELIVVDDGSTDGTVDRLRRDWSEVPRVRVLQLSRNFGKEAALSAGLKVARGDAVILMDADAQHPPELLPELVRRWREGVDMVYAVRHNRQDEPRLKRWGARAFYRLLNAGDRFEVPPGAGDFRIMDRKVVDALMALPERTRFMKGLYAWVGFTTLALPYQPAPRTSGTSHFGPWHLLRLSLDGLTAFTTLPLRAVSVTGMLLALAAFAYGAWLTVDYLLFSHPVSGWTTIVVGMMLFSGVQLVSLGIVGEYVGRIFDEVKQRPLYIVKADFGEGLGRPADR
jgi:polyisoprenyl-phosphate glycosyltransferase